MASADGGQQEGGESRDAVPDDEGEHMPQRFTIGTQAAFNNNDAYLYEKEELASETIYVCEKGSNYKREGEKLVLRREGDTWTAYDCVFSDDGKIQKWRQAVFRCKGDNITKPGTYVWETNSNASPRNESSEEKWEGDLPAETRHEGTNVA